MGNHCVKVVCEECGEVMCLRCNWGFRPDEERAKKVRENLAKADREPVVFEEVHHGACSGRLVGKGWIHS